MRWRPAALADYEQLDKRALLDAYEAAKREDSLVAG